MRAIFIFFIFATFFITGCASVNVAKEMTKATHKVEASIKNIFKLPTEEKKNNKILDEKQEISTEKQEISAEGSNKQQILEDEKQEIFKEQEIISKVVIIQKKAASIELMNKNMDELNQIIGPANLIRKDGKTITARFDSINCSFFVFMNSTLKIPRVEYYELRNDLGDLIDNRKDIESCFKEIKPV